MSTGKLYEFYNNILLGMIASAFTTTFIEQINIWLDLVLKITGIVSFLLYLVINTSKIKEGFKKIFTKTVKNEGNK